MEDWLATQCFHHIELPILQLQKATKNSKSGVRQEQLALATDDGFFYTNTIGLYGGWDHLN
jgi:hypothetical protein